MTEPDRDTVVLRFRDGRTQRVQLTGSFSPNDFEITVETETDELLDIQVTDLKAIFFLKDPRQRSAELAMSASREMPGTALARVEFFDGEIIRGRVQHYSVADAGFFLYPTAAESNNDRIFVVATALNTVAIEG